MRGKQYTRAQLEAIERLFLSGSTATEVAAVFGVTTVAIRKLRHRMRLAGWDVGTGTGAHPMPRKGGA